MSHRTRTSRSLAIFGPKIRTILTQEYYDVSTTVTSRWTMVRCHDNFFSTAQYCLDTKRTGKEQAKNTHFPLFSGVGQILKLAENPKTNFETPLLHNDVYPTLKWQSVTRDSNICFQRGKFRGEARAWWLVLVELRKFEIDHNISQSEQHNQSRWKEIT